MLSYHISGGESRGVISWQVVQAWTVAGSHLRGGFPPGPGRGIQAFSRESPDAKSRGGMPPAPRFRARSLPLARFGVGCHIVPVDRLLRAPCTYPDLEAFFRKMLFEHIFSGKCVPNRSEYTGSNSPTILPETTTPKTSEWERAAIKSRGSRGRSPRRSFLRLSPEKAGLPRRSRRGKPLGRAGPAAVLTGPPPAPALH